NSEARNANGESFVIAADKIVRRETRFTAPNDASFGSGPSHIEGDCRFEIESLAERHRPDHAAGWARFHHLDALAPRHFDFREATVGLHDHEAAREPIASHAPLKVAKVAVYLRPHVSDGSHRRSALILTVLTRQLMGGTDEKIRIGFTKDLAHADLVLRCPVRMEEQHGDGLESLLLDNVGNFACGSLIERSPHGAIGKHPLRNFKNIFTRHQRPVLAESQVERFRTIDSADLVDIAEPQGCDESGFRARPFDDGIDDHGRTVNQQRSRMQRYRCLREAFLHALGQFHWGREHFRERQRALRFVEYNYVRKRSAYVNSYAQFVSPLSNFRPPQVQIEPTVALAALSAPMVRQIARQPLIPCLVDFLDCLQFGIGALQFVNRSNDPEVNTLEMRISTKMIADNNGTFRFEIAQCALDEFRTELRTLQQRRQFGNEAGFFCPAFQQFKNYLPDIAGLTGVLFVHATVPLPSNPEHYTSQPSP